MTPAQIALLILAISSIIIFGSFSIASFRENETRAFVLSSLFTFFMLLLFLIPLFLKPIIQYWILGISVAMLILFFIAFVLPIGIPNHKLEETQARIDERRVVFSRNELVPGSKEYQEYYQNHPEDLEKDQKWRSNPGLMSPESKFFESFSFSVAGASFSTLKNLAQFANGPIAPNKTLFPLERVSQSIKTLAKYYGALDVGICLLNPAYIYTHSGRGSEPYGKQVNLDHKYAIAMTFEMHHEMIAANPHPPGIVETGRQYANSALAAVQMAATIRNFGYSATAHFEGHYQVICPPIARDAGLGEIGRMSLLITPKKGPRVRLAVVTTDLPLVPDQPMVDPSVIDFCTICKKCATNCPTHAIPLTKRENHNGALRWTINPEACYGYWTQTGTDCGRCMSVCPYSHPDIFPHKLIRWGSRHSGFFRRAALLMDDLFYGKHPKLKSIMKWTHPSPH